MSDFKAIQAAISEAEHALLSSGRGRKLRVSAAGRIDVIDSRGRSLGELPGVDLALWRTDQDRPEGRFVLGGPVPKAEPLPSCGRCGQSLECRCPLEIYDRGLPLCSPCARSIAPRFLVHLHTVGLVLAAFVGPGSTLGDQELRQRAASFLGLVEGEEADDDGRRALDRLLGLLALEKDLEP